VLSGTSNTIISGTIYDDLNSNGVKDNGENGLVGWKVYLDLDESGTLNTDSVGTLEPSVLTNVDGDFSINHLQPYTYRVAHVVQPGWTPTSPAFQDVTVTNNNESKVNFFDFGGGSITGTIWNDLNADGVRAKDSGTGEYTDPGMANWSVFLDLNNNTIADPSEPQTLTDATGSFAFHNLPAGDYEVTEVVPSGWDVSPTFDKRITAAVKAISTTSVEFANFSLSNGSIQGTIWNDLNGDAIRATDPSSGEFTDPGLAGWTVFLDLNSNGMADFG